MFYGGMSSVPGAPGNLMAGIDLPFGGGERYKQLQKENQPGAPRPTPGISPTRIFPPNEPGREGAIDVRFRQALGGSPGAAGNLGGLQFAQTQYPSTPVYYDDHMKQFVPRPGSGGGSSTPVKNYPGLGIAPKVPLASNEIFNSIGNVGSLVAQINPTYPVGDPRYGRPMQMGSQPMSMSTSEYGWMQGMNRLREANPEAYENVKAMMGQYGWNKPPAGFKVPPGI